MLNRSSFPSVGIVRAAEFSEDVMTMTVQGQIGYWERNLLMRSVDVGIRENVSIVGPVPFRSIE